MKSLPLLILPGSTIPDVSTTHRVAQYRTWRSRWQYHTRCQYHAPRSSRAKQLQRTSVRGSRVADSGLEH
eukprot:135904-Rhodomonas_salina.2